MPLSTAYQLIGMSRFSTSIEEVRSRYKQLALRHHPDKDSRPNANDRMAEITNAYEAVVKDITAFVSDTLNASTKAKPKPPPKPKPQPCTLSYDEALRHWTLARSLAHQGSLPISHLIKAYRNCQDQPRRKPTAFCFRDRQEARKGFATAQGFPSQHRAESWEAREIHSCSVRPMVVPRQDGWQ